METYTHSSLFERVAKDLRVAEIANPIKISVSSDELLASVRDQFIEELSPENWFCLVQEGNEIKGHIAFDDLDLDDEEVLGTRNAGELAIPIRPESTISASQSLLEVFPLFEEFYYLFGLTGSNITHVVSFPDLDKLPVKLCLFSLFLEFESGMIEVLSSDYSALGSCLESLPNQRLEKAKELCNIKYKHEDPTGLLLCTTFIDKMKMLDRSTDITKRLPFRSKRERNGFFSRVQDLRNQIAHSDSILEVLKNPKEFNEFIRALQKATATIAEMARE